MGQTRAVNNHQKPSRKARLCLARRAASQAPLRPQQGPKTLYEIDGVKVIATDVFDTFWKFAAERKAIYDKRVRGENSPYVVVFKLISTMA